MASGQDQARGSRTSSTSTPSEPREASDVAARKDKIDADVDAILDDIDDVLEQNAAEFVSSFVQKGGE
ncbi:MAG: ubiquitin-like protein Pup [Actinomycetes bacterium]